ncbi:MAG TPA: YebC/PmpR family DNA-binding transcriptional regulator [Patescibacteria group bacterium]
MSGHSHYATTHRQKELKDAARGQVFSKLARQITIAAKTGGGPNPDSNFKLRVIVEKARAVSMPKENIERAISKAENSAELEEITYEGFGPGGIGIMVEAGTDNRNRTANEIKNIFDKSGGKFAGPGAVSFNFDHMGLLIVEKEGNADEQMLKLIDLGAADVEDAGDSIEVYVAPNDLFSVQKKLIDAGFKVTTTELTQRPKNYQELSDPDQIEKATKLLDTLHEHDDVQKVYTNLATSN